MSKTIAKCRSDCKKCPAKNVRTRRHLHKDLCDVCYKSAMGVIKQRDAEYRSVLFKL